MHKRLVEVQSEIRSIKLNLLKWNNCDKVNEALIMLQDGITHLRWEERLDGKVFCAKLQLQGSSAGKYIKVDLNKEWVVENIRPELVEHVKYQTHGGWTALEVTARSKSLDYQADDGDDIIHIRELKFVPQKMMRLNDTYDGDGEDIVD